MTITAAGRVTLINRALVQLGQAATFTVDSADRRAGKIDLVWPAVVDRCFGLYAWSWSKQTIRLARVAAAPETGYPFAYALPGGIAGPALKFYGDALGRYRIDDFLIEAGTIATRAEAVWATAPYPVDPEAWDPGFRSAFVTALASALAVPLQQDENLRDALEAAAFGTASQGGAGGMFGRLIAQDRAAAPITSPFDRGDPLTDARYLP